MYLEAAALLHVPRAARHLPARLVEMMALTVATAPQLVVLRRRHGAARREAARRDEGVPAGADPATLPPLPLPPQLERFALANVAHACKARLEGYPRSLEADRAALGRAEAHGGMRRVLLLRVAEQAILEVALEIAEQRQEQLAPKPAAATA